MRTDELIEMLVHDATPVPRLPPPWRRAAVWVAISLLYISLLVIASPNVARIAAIRAPRFWFEQTAALTTAITAAVAALISVVPGRSRRVWLLPLAGLSPWIGVLVWGSIHDWAARGSAGLVVYSDWPCVAAMISGALLPAIALAVMLRRGAPPMPRASAAFAGLAVGGFSSMTACLSRPSPHGTTATVLVWHLGVVLLMASAGAWAGRYLREWPLTPAIARRMQ
jgi:hypothetical protein